VQLILWVLCGAAAGWLTGKLLLSEGRDQIMDLVMGLAGGIGGGFIFSATRFQPQGKVVYTALSAVLGAIVLTLFSRFVTGKLEYGATD
jgi:uncharacterized membrane protein YeaQ/YmgE (transglycosylase-associated protein family)